MTKESMNHDIAEIRSLLRAAFDTKDLRRFCDDRPELRPVCNNFGPNHGLDDMIDKVIRYCERFLLLDMLLDEVKRYNPRQYARWETEYTEGDDVNSLVAPASTPGVLPNKDSPETTPQAAQEPSSTPAEVQLRDDDSPTSNGEQRRGWLIRVLRDPAWQAVGAILAVVALGVALGAWFWPDIRSMLFPTPTAEPSAAPDPTFTAPPVTPKPILTATPTPTPTPEYEILDSFEFDGMPDPTQWVVTKNDCFQYGVEDDYLRMRCTQIPDGTESVSMRLAPVESDWQAQGIAIRGRVKAGNDPIESYLAIVVHFTDAVGTSEEVRYTLALSEGSVIVRGTEGTLHTRSPQEPDGFHELRVEHVGSHIVFFVDGEELVLHQPANVPEGYAWSKWYITTKIDNVTPPDDHIETAIDWVEWIPPRP